jgi:hypothetical protein
LPLPEAAAQFDAGAIRRGHTFQNALQSARGNGGFHDASFNKK